MDGGRLMLRITGCQDAQLWYWGLVGQCVPYAGRVAGESVWLAREPHGYTNIVRFGDAELVEFAPGAAEPVCVPEHQDELMRGSDHG